MKILDMIFSIIDFILPINKYIDKCKLVLVGFYHIVMRVVNMILSINFGRFEEPQPSLFH